MMVKCLFSLLDLSVAFDTIDHDILFHRLEDVFGIQNSALSFFRSYLTDRKQINGIHFWLQFKSFHSPSWRTSGLSSRSHSVFTIIDRNSVSHSEFAYDSQLYDSVPREQLDSLLRNMQSCVDEVKLLMTQNKLQLNEGKTEALLIDPQNSPNHPLSITIGQNDICFSRSVRNLGVIFDDKLSMKQQVSKMC